MVTMPDSSERVFIVKDTTTRSASHYTLTVKTVSGTGVIIPAGATAQVFSNGTNISLGLLTKVITQQVQLTLQLLVIK